MPPADPARLLTRPFLLVVASGLAYFLALAMLTPVLPHYVEDELHGGKVAVGVAVGSFAFGAVALRTYAGRLGDRIGRRVLIIGGALAVAGSTALYGVVPSLWWLLAVRTITGFGEAAFFVGAATMITDLAPVNRRGEAVSYWSVAVYGGLALGPALGDYVRGDDRYLAAWLTSAGLALVAATLGAATREVVRPPSVSTSRHLVHRAALLPGVVLFCGLIPLAAFSTFVPLYVERFDIDAGPVFLLYGVLVLFVRILGARVPDRLGGRVGATGALTFSGLGIAIVAAWPSVPGLIAGTVVFAAGMSLMYPALLLLALHDIPDGERASVVATFSSFFDLSQGVGAALCGIVAELAGNRGAFATGAVAAALGLVVLRRPVPGTVDATPP
ncbi:MAG: MFS transporter [Actinomycetota bacterium]